MKQRCDLKVGATWLVFSTIACLRSYFFEIVCECLSELSVSVSVSVHAFLYV